MSADINESLGNRALETSDRLIQVDAQPNITKNRDLVSYILNCALIGKKIVSPEQKVSVRLFGSGLA